MLSIRNKTYLILLGITMLFFGIAAGFVWVVAQKELITLQKSHAEEELQLVERILNRELDNLVVKQADWARWDDTYQFVSDRNEDYIFSNLNDESLKVLGLNLMVFVNNNSEMVYGKQVYGETSTDGTVPHTLEKYFQGRSELLDFTDMTSAHKGILTIPEGMLLVASQPITTSDGRGDRRGTIIFARYIDEEYTRTLTELAGIKVDLLPYGFNDGGENNDLQVDDGSRIEFRGNQVQGFQLIDNVFGNPSLLLRVEYPAQFLNQGKVFILQGIGYSFFVLITYVSLIIIIIDIFLLRRIENLRQVVRKISVLQSGEVPEGDIDDFSYLATVMMGAIKNAQQSKNIIAGNQGELAKFKMVIDQSLDHTIITDQEGKILYANAAAEELTGYSLDEMIGKTPALWGRQMSREFYATFWDIIRLKKQVFEGELTNRRKDGKRYRAYLRVIPVLDGDKRVLYFIGFERFIAFSQKSS